MITVAALFLISMMFAVGLSLRRGQIREELRLRPSTIARALAANYILVPLVALTLVWLFDLSFRLAAGLFLLAASPGAPLMIQFTGRVEEKSALAATLLLVLSFSGVLLTPFLAGVLLSTGDISFPFGRALMGLFLFLLLPMALGMLTRGRWPDKAASLSKLFSFLALLLFAGFILLTFQLRSESVRSLAGRDVVLILVFTVLTLVAGWVAGGPDRGSRQVLAAATSMRNVAVALFIAWRYFPESGADVVVLVFSALVVPANLLFTFLCAWLNRRGRAPV